MYIYGDQGTTGVGEIKQMFRASSQTVRVLMAEDVIAGRWRADANLFIMPGGADRFYQEKLRGEGNRQIIDWVKLQGGLYVGICAGAYYAGDSITFKKEAYPIPVIEVERELKFFPGKVEGPAFDTIPSSDYPTVNVNVFSEKWSNGQNEILNFYYKDGGHFILPPPQGWRGKVFYYFYESSPPYYERSYTSGRWQTLFEYAAPAVLVSCVGGHGGGALLMSIHPEFEKEKTLWFNEMVIKSSKECLRYGY